MKKKKLTKTMILKALETNRLNFYSLSKEQQHAITQLFLDSSKNMFFRFNVATLKQLK